MYCNKCGYQIKTGDLYCSNCGNKVGVDENNMNFVEVNNNTSNVNNDLDETKKANTLCTISLLLSFGAGIPLGIVSVMIPFLKALISSVAGLCPLAGFVLMIYVRVKYPDNTYGKVVMWVHIVFAIIFVVSIILLYIACYLACNNTNMSGCG